MRLKLPRAWRFAITLALLAAACGSAPSSLDPALPCPAPTPAPTALASPEEAAYRNAIFRGVGLLRELNEGWAKDHPSRKLSNGSGFRANFAAYADESICIATTLRDLRPPLAKYEAFDAAFDAEMAQTIVVMERGRTAVSRRNKSDFNDWNKAVDTRTGEIEAVRRTIPPR